MLAVLNNFAEVLEVIGKSNGLSKKDKQRLEYFIQDCIERVESYDVSEWERREENRKKNKIVAKEILESMQGNSDNKYTVSEICKKMDCSQQRIVYVLHEYLMPKGQVIRERWHDRVTVFSLPEEV